MSDRGHLSGILSHVCKSPVYQGACRGAHLHAAVVVELCPRLGHGGLVGDGDHAHPAPQHPQRVHCVEALRAAVHLRHCPHTAVVMRTADAALAPVHGTLTEPSSQCILSNFPLQRRKYRAC